MKIQAPTKKKNTLLRNLKQSKNNSWAGRVGYEHFFTHVLIRVEEFFSAHWSFFLRQPLTFSVGDLIERFFANVWFFVEVLQGFRIWKKKKKNDFRGIFHSLIRFHFSHSSLACVIFFFKSRLVE
jgi:hypothetical protein